VISPAVLEQPGRWRITGLVLGLVLVASPTLPPLLGAVSWSEAGLGLGSAFPSSVARSAIVAIGTALYALVLGFPCGLFSGLYRFPARRFLLALLAVPLLLPSFLWSIGLSMLRIELGLPSDGPLSGASGCIMSFAALGTPLVVFGVLLAVRTLPNRAIDAARLAGGEAAVLRYAGQAALPAGVAASLLAGLMSMADPGPGQILGFPGAGAQILISFSALYDFELAARQCLAIAGVALLAAAPLIWFVARHLTAALLPGSVELMRPRSWPKASWAGPSLLGLVLIVTLAAPVAGLVQPVLAHLWLDRIVEVFTRTGINTLFYGLVAGIVATGLAIPLVICAARVASLRVALFIGLTVVFVLPPALGALGAVLATSEAPDWLDPLLRSRLTVAAVLGMRLTPVAAIIMIRSIGSAPPSWALAAAVHGVPFATYLRKLLAPFLARPAMVSVALVALLATADVTTVLLLQPPGRDSLPVALFTVMANAPESMVASLCLAYLLMGYLVIGALSILLEPGRP
jgi:iron(III) transport system permease protein